MKAHTGTGPGLNLKRWIRHFERNRLCRAEPDWKVPLRLSGPVLAALTPSIVQFQLGDGGGECRLIAFDAERFRGVSEEMRQVVDMWFAEEAEHSRLLGCAVERLGGRRIESHWSFEAFCWVRRAMGARFELQVLTLTELVSTAYYRLVRRHVEDEPIQAMCGLILRDEGGHVAFHRERLAAGLQGSSGLGLWGWQIQFWSCGYGAASVLWLSHRRCLLGVGATRREFFFEVRRQLGRFISATLALRNRQGSAQPPRTGSHPVPPALPQPRNAA